MNLLLETREVGRVTIVRCKGRLVSGGETEALRAHVAHLLRDRRSIVLHLGEVVFIDSSGLGTMVRTLTSTRQVHGDLKLCDVPEHVRKVLQLSHLTKLFDSHESEDHAVAAFYRKPVQAEQPVSMGRSVLCVDRNVESRNPRIGKFVNHIRAQQARICRQIDPEVSLRRVISNAMDEVRTQKRLATHVRENPAAGPVQPVHGTFRRILRHSFHFIVKGPTVMTIEIAFKFRKQVSNQWMKIACSYARPNVREEPALHGVIDLTCRPTAFLRRIPAGIFVNRAKQLWALRKDGLRQSLRYSTGLELDALTYRTGKQLVQRNIETET